MNFLSVFGNLFSPVKNRDGGGLQGSHHGLILAAGGLTNDPGSRIRRRQFEELGLTFGIIGQGMGFAGQMQLQ